MGQVARGHSSYETPSERNKARKVRLADINHIIGSAATYELCESCVQWPDTIWDWQVGPADGQKELTDNHHVPQNTSIEGDYCDFFCLYLKKIQTVIAYYSFRKLFLANHFVKFNCHNILPSEVNSLPNLAKVVTSKQICLSKALFKFITYLVPVVDGSQPGSLFDHLIISLLWP